ncbi:endonuclease/exonuclease/phosphatase family protein [Pseudooctadecabacter sp.]|uniref:endonuclease/exonuclease/phosphatase family protein n=1 Tax=Pseudooctadecabacter sp. TaxID=1966338 RepID=UPI0025EE9860|nr:endonuclease/exonuclease/phosphatase family protein [Pseudooctadecabacter sp.]
MAGATSVAADQSIRIATYAAPLSRDSPALLLRDILKADDPQIAAVGRIITHVAPDILVLTDFDFDANLAALGAFSDSLAVPYPHLYAALPNTGRQTGLDLDANGYRGDARDAVGYGRFLGDGGIAILSRYPVLSAEVVDLSDVLWREVPGHVLPQRDGTLFPDAAAFDSLPVSSNAHWMVPVVVGQTRLTLLAFDATAPVFDGPEDFNGLRNRDELRLWEAALTGHFGPAPVNPVLIGNANADPNDGEGVRAGISALLDHPALQPTNPASLGAVEAADDWHTGPPRHDTADWPDDGPGNLRVSYVVPSANLRVLDQGVFWPPESDPLAQLLEGTGPHRLVWIDVAVPP